MIAVAHSTKAFCVGQAKSGTASLAGLLRRDFRTEHEPEREATIDLVVARARGDFESVDFGEVLVDRDKRLNLGYEWPRFLRSAGSFFARTRSAVHTSR